MRRPNPGIVVLQAVHDHPGLNAVELRDQGFVTKPQLRLLSEFEKAGFIEYRNNRGWHLTSAGDLSLGCLGDLK